MAPWCKTWQLSGINRISARQKLHRKLRGACKSSWSWLGNQKSFTLPMSWSLAMPVKIFPAIIVRRHHTDRKQMGLLKEQYAELKKGHLPYCYNQVWMKKRWAESMECYYYLRNIQDILSDGKTPYERRWSGHGIQVAAAPWEWHTQGGRTN